MVSFPCAHTRNEARLGLGWARNEGHEILSGLACCRWGYRAKQNVQFIYIFIFHFGTGGKGG